MVGYTSAGIHVTVYLRKEIYIGTNKTQGSGHPATIACHRIMHSFTYLHLLSVTEITVPKTNTETRGRERERERERESIKTHFASNLSVKGEETELSSAILL